MRSVDRVLGRAGAAVDKIALRVMERVISRSAPRRPPKNARDLLDGLSAHYEGLGDEFFPAPPAPKVTETPVRTRITPTGLALDLTYSSGYSSSLSLYAGELASHEENQLARARLYSGGAGRPVVVAIHGWGGGQPWLEERAFEVGRAVRAGFDVVLFQLPFHADRAGKKGLAGALFPSPHIVRTNEAFGQAIWDLRRLDRYLREVRGAPAVAVMGMSLGGYTAALWTSLDDSLAAAIPIIPAVSMADLMWRHGTDSPVQKRARDAGVDRDLLASTFAVHAPLSRPPQIDGSRLMIVAGRADQITPADQAASLWRHWGEPRMHWFPGGHLAQLGRREAFREVRGFLAGAFYGE